MRKDITVVAEHRQTRGNNAARRLRGTGKIPAVLYGAGKDSVAITVNPKEINRILHSSTGHNTIFNLDVQGIENVPAMIVDWRHDPVRDTLLHIDLKRIDLAKRLHVRVPVHTAGEPIGVKTQGGQMDIVTREVEIECLPDEIPEHFTVDVHDLLIGQSMRANKVALSGSMKLLTNPDAVLCHIIALRTSETAAPAEAEAAPAVEPEVIKKGKKEEEAAEEKGKKK